MTIAAKKLIEVALPLEAINKASAKEKSIRQGNPSTLHLWWARRPLAAARAVIFAQMVDDPSARPDLFPTEKAQDKERKRLFKIIEDLVQWENTTNETVLQRARDEIWESWRRACAENSDHPRANELFDRNKLPAFHDPFAGGGALPLEAQRLGLEAYASDLNPVAVLICKAMIEIPPRFAGRSPVNPEWQTKSETEKALMTWKGAQGLAEDVRYYGKWMRDEAEKRIGHLYPRVDVTAGMAKERPDLKPHVGKKLTVVAWLWARTVKSPNPAFSDVEVPLATTFMLSTRKGKEAYIEPVIEDGGYRFTVKVGKPRDMEAAKRGTKLGGSHSSFFCLMSGAPMTFEYLRSEAKAGRMGSRLMAIIAEGDRSRVYLPPIAEHERIARQARPDWRPEAEIQHWPGRTNVVEYGLTRFGDLFAERQLMALITFSDLAQHVRECVLPDARAAGLARDDLPLREGGASAIAYAESVETFLGLGIGRSANYWSSLTPWGGDFIVQTFGRQAIPMVWDHAEGNPFSSSSGNWTGALEWIEKVMVKALPASPEGVALQLDAQTQELSRDKIVSTDPPYYDNIAYADLSDFFYVWLRRSLHAVFPDLFTTLAVPKAEELIASPYRHGGKERAEEFFLNGMTQAMARLADQTSPAFPVTIYYAFKQSETEGKTGTASTGWETFLEAVIQSGLALSGTWPMRTERDQGLKTGMNVLASSIVLVCRPRNTATLAATHREFANALKAELPAAVAHLQRGNIAPVDLAQASIGPGMAIYTRYSEILDASGKRLPVRKALALINEILDEALAQQEGDFDADTRWAIAWFEQQGFAEGEFGLANVLATAKNTSVQGMKDAGILVSGRGKVRLLRPEELISSSNPATDDRLTTWEMVHQLVRLLESGGEGAAAMLVNKLGFSRSEVARQLAYRLYHLCERKKRMKEAASYNALVQAWPELVTLAASGQPNTGRQPVLGI